MFGIIIIGNLGDLLNVSMCSKDDYERLYGKRCLKSLPIYCSLLFAVNPMGT